MKTFAVYKKEVVSLFLSPIAYIFMALFLFLLSLLVTQSLYTSDLRDVMSMMMLLLLFLLPVTTMRSFSEEFRMGTDELLLTSPLTLTHIVVGKFFAVLTLIFLLFACTGQYAVLVSMYGSPDWPVILSGYLGLFLVCAQLVALGIFASSLTENQFIAAIITLVGSLFFLVVDVLGQYATSGWLADTFEQLNIFYHYNDFENGMLDLSHFIYYIGMIILFLFLTVRNLETKRW